MKINRKQILQQIIKEKPDTAILVKNKYRVLVGLIKRIYPQNFEKIPIYIWEDIAFDIVNGNRTWQMLTEGFDKENKKQLEDRWLIENNHVPNPNRSLLLENIEKK